MTPPKVSVILPVHNRRDVLARAIQSVLDQRLRAFELIVIDDGSTDDSVAVARAFEDERIKIIEMGSNRGGDAARNAGIRAATAPLVAFLDSDDAYLPEKLETVVAEFDREPRLDLLVDSFVKVQPRGALRPRVVRKNPVIRDTTTFRKALLRRVLWKATPSITARKTALERAGLFDESLQRLQDLELLIRASAFANCASTDRVLWVKYWDPKAISARDDMIAANAELARRHPECSTTSEYRLGLGYVVRLKLWRRLRKADLRGAINDLRQLAQGFGAREAAGLMLAACRPRRSP
jgi:glycosyltransferase involved in cell wall biosynthesis